MFYNVHMRTAKTVSITLPPDLLLKAQELAQREHRTMSELFREALRRYMVGMHSGTACSRGPVPKAKPLALLEKPTSNVSRMNIAATSGDDSSRRRYECLCFRADVRGSLLDLAFLESFVLVISPALLDELEEKLRLKFDVPSEDTAIIRAKLESTA